MTTHLTDPTDADTDDDGFSDKVEADYGTNPSLATSKPAEVTAGSVALQVAPGTQWTMLGDGSYQADGTVVLTAVGSGESTLLVRASARARPDIMGSQPERVQIEPRALPLPMRQRLMGADRIDAGAGTITINGIVTVLPGGVGINATGALVLSLGPGMDMTLASNASYSVNPNTGHPDGQREPEHERADRAVEFRQLRPLRRRRPGDDRPGNRRGERQGGHQAAHGGHAADLQHVGCQLCLQPDRQAAPPVRAWGSDVIPLDMIGLDNDFTMGEAEIYINAQAGSFLGRAELLNWELGDEFFGANGPSLEIGLDRTRDRFWFSADLSAEAKIQAGGLSLTVSAPAGGHFAFETGIRRPYWLIRAGIEIPPVSEVLSINEVLIEIDPSGGAVLTPEYPVGNILTQPITGHLRLLGDVTVHIPIPPPVATRQAVEDPDETDVAPDAVSLLPSLDIHLAGEILWRLDLTGCNHVLAGNVTIGLGVSAGPVGLMYDFAGTSMHLAMGGSFPSCYPQLLSISMVQNGIELGRPGRLRSLTNWAGST